MMKNKCAHPKCDIEKPVNQYACRGHWFSLTHVIRGKIWNAYRHKGALSPEWLAADKEAQQYWKERSR